MEIHKPAEREVYLLVHVLGRDIMPQQIISKEMDSELMLYDTEQDSVHVLNPTARTIYYLYKKGRNPTEIEEEVRKRFQTDNDHDFHGDVLRCLDELHGKKLIGV